MINQAPRELARLDAVLAGLRPDEPAGISARFAAACLHVALRPAATLAACVHHPLDAWLSASVARLEGARAASRAIAQRASGARRQPPVDGRRGRIDGAATPVQVRLEGVAVQPARRRVDDGPASVRACRAGKAAVDAQHDAELSSIAL